MTDSGSLRSAAMRLIEDPLGTENTFWTHEPLRSGLDSAGKRYVQIAHKPVQAVTELRFEIIKPKAYRDQRNYGFPYS